MCVERAVAADDFARLCELRAGWLRPITSYLNVSSGKRPAIALPRERRPLKVWAGTHSGCFQACPLSLPFSEAFPIPC